MRALAAGEALLSLQCSSPSLPRPGGGLVLAGVRRRCASKPLRQAGASCSPKACSPKTPVRANSCGRIAAFSSGAVAAGAAAVARQGSRGSLTVEGSSFSSVARPPKEPQREVAGPENKQHPASFYCPISRQCMHDPVVLTDGHTYERRHIERWLKENHTSPVSGLPLRDKATFPNHALRNAIEEYFEKVLAGHRKAVQSTISALRAGKGKRRVSDDLLGTIDSLMQCSILVNADLSLERALKGIMDEARNLVGAEVASVFLVDEERQELFSTVNSTGGELRIPISAGIAGKVASSGAPVIVKEAYADERFNHEIDEMTGFTTRNIMCVPVQSWKKGVIGVAQLINKTSTGLLSAGENQRAERHFTEDDQHFFQVLASQAAVAVVSSGFFEKEGEASRGSSKVVNVRSGGSEASCSSIKKESTALARPMLTQALRGWELDTLALAEVTGEKPLATLFARLLEHLEYRSYFSLCEKRLARFLAELERGYGKTSHVQYHNRAHAASVLHFSHALLEMGAARRTAARALPAVEGEERREKLAGLAVLFAAAVHDFEHVGLSNDFMVKSFSERALRHNDRSPNESHHVAAAFELLHRPDCNFLEGLPLVEYRAFRKLVIDLVLGTDMAENARILKGCEGLQGAGELSREEALLATQLMLKAADLGHLALPWTLHVRWVRRLEQEFFMQGDREKESGFHEKVSFLMDREGPGISESQLEFFDGMALPLFSRLTQVFPKAAPMFKAVEGNYQRWRAVEGP